MLIINLNSIVINYIKLQTIVHQSWFARWRFDNKPKACRKMLLIHTKSIPWCHFSTLYKPNSRRMDQVTTSYGLRFYMEGLFSTFYFSTSSHPSIPDLGRWRCAQDNISEVVSIIKTPAVPGLPRWSSQGDWTSAGWRCEAASGPLIDLETTLSTSHT